MQAENFTDRIRRRAYEIWEAAGRPNGCDINHWLQAEMECRTKMTAGKEPDRSPEASENQPKRTRTSRPRQEPKRPKA
jgi:hypothetical protein